MSGSCRSAPMQERQHPSMGSATRKAAAPPHGAACVRTIKGVGCGLHLNPQAAGGCASGAQVQHSQACLLARRHAVTELDRNVGHEVCSKREGRGGVWQGSEASRAGSCTPAGSQLRGACSGAAHCGKQERSGRVPALPFIQLRELPVTLISASTSQPPMPQVPDLWWHCRCSHCWRCRSSRPAQGSRTSS